MKKINMVLYGANLTGKTTMAVKFPNHHVISLDGNAQYVTDSYTNVNNYAEFMKVFNEHDKAGNVIVIDTANILLNWVRYEHLEGMGIEYEADANDHGRTWDMLKKMYVKLMENLTTKSEASIIFLFHETEVQEEDEIGVSHTVYMPLIPSTRVAGEIFASMTLVGRTVRAKGKYGIDFGTKDNYKFTGARMPHKKKTIMADLESFKENFPIVFSDEKTAQKKD
ncbi:NTP-binding protein [Weissella phage PWc]|nr:NTP-binding protein [Weissella phage PWc]